MARGFLSFSKEKRLAVARKGGLMAQKTKKCHLWTSEEARLAGMKGGKNRWANRDKFKKKNHDKQ